MLVGVKVAIGGKGGVGKTTVCAVLAGIIARRGADVLAIDADSDANLCMAFGLDEKDRPKPLIAMKDLIAERAGTGREAPGIYFKLNPKVSDLPEAYQVAVPVDGDPETTGTLKLLVLGGLTRAGGGCACPEGAFLKAMMTHTILARRECVLVDLAAGVEFMGRASVRGTDALIVVVEPGHRSIETALSIAAMAREMGITRIVAVANKLTDPSQRAMIETPLADAGIPLLAAMEYSRDVQAADLRAHSVCHADPRLVEALTGAADALGRMLAVPATETG